MNTAGNDRLRELLAAEYALGTLRGAARRRFETWARDDADLRARAVAWDERLAPLMAGVADRVPPRRVWDAIEARLPGYQALRGERRSAPVSWWDRVALWRGLSAAFATIAVVAIGVSMKPPPVVPVPEPRVVEAMPTVVATIMDMKGTKPVAMVLEMQNGAMLVKVADDVDVPEGKDLQLWSSTDGKSMTSQGVIPVAARTSMTRISPENAAALATAKAFGLSLEPAGGSPQPTQVLGLGAGTRVRS